jgi:excisionase family DNA binding protein
MPERWLKTPEVAERYGLHVLTVRRAIARGDLHAVKLGPAGKWLVSERDLDAALISNREIGPGTPQDGAVDDARRAADGPSGAVEAACRPTKEKP